MELSTLEVSISQQKSNTNHTHHSVTDGCRADRSCSSYFTSKSEESEDKELEEQDTELSLSLSLCTAVAFASSQFFAVFLLLFLPALGGEAQAPAVPAATNAAPTVAPGANGRAQAQPLLRRRRPVRPPLLNPEEEDPSNHFSG